MTPLSRRFYRRDAVALARALLGKELVRVLPGGGRISGRIVEVEAYLGAADRAAHTYRGRRTDRNASMFLDGGHAYVYFTYGMHFCFNVTADREDVPTACLVRALEPLEGSKRMRRHREHRRGGRRRPLRETDLCSGPAKLAQALAIDRNLDGIDLVAGRK
ncbi:MAG: DNA-3-methyladenine glycosylase, partial [Phycisphaerae bacterium]|nr:DNA-3-methyladenine glycosylase [Phycisphaerae bacterium]